MHLVVLKSFEIDGFEKAEVNDVEITIGSFCSVGSGAVAI